MRNDAATTARPLQVGISTPWDLFDLDAPARRARLGAIADAGIDAVFTADHVSFHGGSGIDGPVRLAALGGIEPRLDLHLGVYLLALRHPMVAARQIATLAEGAPGRVTIGVGVGGEDRHEFEVCGVDPSTRGRRTDESLRLVRALLAGETVDGDEHFGELRDGRIHPVPDPAIPFVVGGRSDAALERAGRLGDGWLATWCSARRFAQGCSTVGELGAGRTPAGGWRHGMQLWVGVGRDADEARAHVSERMRRFYRLDFEVFERYTPVGDAAAIAEFLAPYVEAGASTLDLTPCGPDPVTEFETIAEVRELLT
ncbi:LLM class flavin-dependent oxidoreductase [Ilumatobacter sp.]|uniref:LLM class flavin-dependent oxidoreductase n=1 Tax=Ilumatobacter sp. TaxID=1967498 RepID=UPI003B525CC8